MSNVFSLPSSQVTRRQLDPILTPRPDFGGKTTFTVVTAGPGLPHHGACSKRDGYQGALAQFMPKTKAKHGLMAWRAKRRGTVRARKLADLITKLRTGKPAPEQVNKLLKSLGNLYDKHGGFDVNMLPDADSDKLARDVTVGIRYLLDLHKEQDAASGVSLGALGMLQKLEQKFSPEAQMQRTRAGIEDLKKHQAALQAKLLLVDGNFEKMSAAKKASLADKLNQINTQLAHAQAQLRTERLQKAEAAIRGMEAQMTDLELGACDHYAEALEVAVQSGNKKAIEDVSDMARAMSEISTTPKDEQVPGVRREFSPLFSGKGLTLEQRTAASLNALTWVAHAFDAAEAKAESAQGPIDEKLKDAFNLYSPQQRESLRQLAQQNAAKGSVVFNGEIDAFTRKK